MAAHILDKQFAVLDAQFKALNSLFISNLNQENLTHSEILETLRTHFTSATFIKQRMDEGIEKHDQITKFHLQNLEVLKKHFISVSSESFLTKIINEYTIATAQYLENTPDILRIEYPLESFKAIDGDPFRVKASYWFEAFFIQLQEVWNISANFFRRRSKQRGKKGETRMLNVQYKKLILGYLFPKYIAHIRNIVKENQRQLMESYLRLFEFEYAFIQNGYTIQQEELAVLEANSMSTNSSILSDFPDQHKKELEVLIQRSGMLFSMKRWRNLGKSQDFNKSRESLIKLNKSWQSTFFAFFEDYRFRELLYAYKHSVQSAHLNVWSIYSQRIKNSLIPEVEKQLEYTSQMLGRLPDPDTSDMEKIYSFFVSELYKLKKGEISEAQQKSILQAAEDIPKLLQKIENELSEKLEIFPKRIGVVNNPKYTSGVKPSEIYYFDPSEFITFECLRDVRIELASQRIKVGKELQRILKEFDEYDQIIDFYLDSAITLTKKPGMAENEVISFFKDGLQRLLKISNRIYELLNELQNEKLSELSALLEKYLENVAQLDDNNNIINIFARLLKSKALAESRSRRLKLSGLTRRTYLKASTHVGKHTKWLKSSYSDLKRKLRLDSSSGPISSEISNHLKDIQHRIYKLPVIYQHLFENIPIKEFNLFLSRENEINRLNSAYNNWLKNNFAASLVIGENGSGKSSLLYYYSKTLKSNYQTLSFQVSRFYYTENDYYALIGEIFSQDELSSDQSIEAFISSIKKRRIVIIDGLERLFIRKVNGFTCLLKLLSLIVSSNHQILWICSVSKYASLYLNKTIALSEYFDYSINIDSLSSEQIQNIVLKRNRLSGFQVKYQMGNSPDGNPPPKKLTQVELEVKFFNELNQFAGSNISLSLNYWLQSILSIKGDLIEIGNFIAPDFSFLDNISLEKAYTLLVVVMHGKISVDQHALIFSQKKDKSYKVLTILKEDSILVKSGEYFILNGILFRHVIRVLENRNFIH